ncbi:hypothetical protein GOEFS_035_00020 [Gordonia effusa NBRC 100432]|uniref:Uncharacterized protein n=1 Tax=Gordonia effusa NBRC 100432 TaxID=1077974 RepID=H0QXC0_9ACTN|nr:hypothetical protein [Gordonia effusa]GAB17471.1 hypothetical protein GOEFS_035_00020 [Gordonia effusa NBRC 100432]
MTHTPTTRRLAGLIARVVAVLALGVALVAAVVAIPTASAETPAERCARETNAYNSAWKQSWVAAHPGKTISDAPAPPVPYTCHDPQTTTPTTPSTAPPATLPGTTSATPGPGPNMGVHAPTDIPTYNNTPIVKAPGRQSTPRTPASTSATPNSTTPRQSQSSQPTAPQLPTGNTFSDKSEFCTRPGVNCAEGDAPKQGDIIGGDDGQRRYFRWSKCPEGQHLMTGATTYFCYTDYDYRVTNIRKTPRGAPSDIVPIGTYDCQTGEVKLSQNTTVKAENSATQSSEIGAEAGLSVDAISGSISKQTGTSETTTIGSESALGSEMSYDTNSCPKGKVVHAYPRYNTYTYDLEKIDTRTGQVVGTIRNLKYYAPIQGVSWEVA